MACTFHTDSNQPSKESFPTLDDELPTGGSSRNNLLVVIFDSNPSQRLVRENPEHLTHVLQSTIVLCNTFLMQQPQNILALLACHHHATEFLYPLPGNPPEVRQKNSQYELFTMVEQTVKQRLNDIICNAPKITTVSESLLAGSLAMALCYISRLQNEAPVGKKTKARILVVTGSSTCSAQYMTYLNVFFTAQKMGVVIDVCTLDKHLGVMQQGCDITGGQYLQPPLLEALLQYMLWVYLPDPSIRSELVLPPPQRVDYRAACFCHRELIDIGFVCSSCLSIFCKYTPICTTCQVIFKTPKLTMFNRRKAKENKK